MSSDSATGKLSILAAVTKPLSFFVLLVLIAEALLGLLLFNASGPDRTIAIVGMLVLLLVCGVAVFLLARNRSLAGASEDSPSVLSFDQVLAELSSTIDRLESDADRLRKICTVHGDAARVIDGLYSGLLYASSAVPTGTIDPLFYGNLMGWQESTGSLRLYHSSGPYNEDVLNRSFKPGHGVAGMALKERRIVIKNSMEDELKLKGEARLQAMMSVPVSLPNDQELVPGSIVILNIDSVKKGVFPQDGVEARAMERRARELAALLAKVNSLRQKVHEKTAAA